MARSDLLVDLVKFAARGDKPKLQATVEAIATEERAKNHGIMADRLLRAMHSGFREAPRPATVWSKGIQMTDSDFYSEIIPERKLEDLILPAGVRAITNELFEEHKNADLLRSHGLEPRHKILLAGAPGNGKTTYAEALAEKLKVPLFVVRYENIITSYLGETSGKLRKLFEQVHQQRCVLFLDEFDVLGKERGDNQETGEIKRVVSTMLLQIDLLPSNVVAVTATNHPELLDRAVWRRFDLRLELPGPTPDQREDFVQMFFRKRGLQPPGLAFLAEMGEASFSDLEKFCLGLLRWHILAPSHPSFDQLVDAGLAGWRDRYRRMEPDFVQAIL